MDNFWRIFNNHLIRSGGICIALDWSIINHAVRVTIKEVLRVIGWEIDNPDHLIVNNIDFIGDSEDKFLGLPFGVEVSLHGDIRND